MKRADKEKILAILTCIQIILIPKLADMIGMWFVPVVCTIFFILLLWYSYGPVTCPENKPPCDFQFHSADYIRKFMVMKRSDKEKILAVLTMIQLMLIPKLADMIGMWSVPVACTIFFILLLWYSYGPVTK